MGYHTNEEFPMRDHAVQCGVQTYLALPVFEPVEKNCVGVIELVTVWKGGYLTYEVERVLNALEGVDLKCPKLCLNRGKSRETKRKRGNQKDVKNRARNTQVALCSSLDSLCEYGNGPQRHVRGLHRAFYYVADEEMDANDHVYDDYYYDDMLCFRDISKLQPLQKDQGVVGKAFFFLASCVIART